MLALRLLLLLVSGIPAASAEDKLPVVDHVAPAQPGARTNQCS